MAPKRLSSGGTADAGQKSISCFFNKKSKPAADVVRKKSPHEVPRNCSQPMQESPRKDSHPLKLPKAAWGASTPPAAPATPDSDSRATSGDVVDRSPLNVTKKSKAPSLGGEELIGNRLKVWWPDDRAWYTGTIARFEAGKGHYIDYDDGDDEWVDLSREKYMLLRGKVEIKGRPKPKRSQVLLSDSDDDMAASEGSDGSGDDSGSEFVAAVEADASSEDELLEQTDDDPAVELEDSPLRSKQLVKRKMASISAPGSSAKKGRRTPQQGTPPRVPREASEEGSPTAPPLSSNVMRKAQPGAKAVLASAGCAAGQFGRRESCGDASTLLPSEMERFAARSSERFPFLAHGKLKDAAGVRPGQPGYNPRTLLLPPNWFKTAKVPPGQQQWWEFKAKNFDSVLLFKMGKFYEMFEMDSHIGVDILGLVLMKGDQPHAGFPEVNYHAYAERLARAGLRVVVIEQTETPAQLAERNEQRKRDRLCKAAVVNRDMVAVVTRGTMADAEMVSGHPEASYLLALCEAPAPHLLPSSPSAGDADGSRKYAGDQQTMLAACAVDVSSGHLVMGEWLDGELRSGLRSHLTALSPVEILLPCGGLSAATHRALAASAEGVQVQKLPGNEFWGADRLRQELKQSCYFGDNSVPTALQAALDGGPTGKTESATLNAVGGAVSYLRTALLDKAVLPAARFAALPPAGAAASRYNATGDPREQEGPEFMALDGAAMQNLEVLENDSGGITGTLLAAVDHTVTPAGRRLLRRWLTRPLGRPTAIVRRQDAIQMLLGDAQDAAREARKLLRGSLDVERAVARLAAAAAGASAREGAGVVLYEDAARRRVAALSGVLRALRSLIKVVAVFDGMTCGSELLTELVTPGRRFPDMEAALEQLEGATDWEEAQSSGRVVPHEGVDPDFDAADSEVKEASGGLHEHLMSVRKALGGNREVCFVSVNKESHLIEVPESLRKQVPRDFEVAAQRKGFIRFRNPELKELVGIYAAAQERREVCLSASLQRLIRKFTEDHAMWRAACDVISELDVLMSLAVAATLGDGGDMCRPQFVAGDAVFEAEQLRHPCAFMTAAAGAFVPNDVNLGGDTGAAPFLLLTGPNMGGKSTLLRQVCLGAVLAQVGAWVPARSLRLSAADAVFVRMGARDHIMAGESTFYVELMETSAMLQAATPRSIVALDELGRGTATTDGAAVASAVLSHLTCRVNCRGMFATHFHRLSEEHAVDPAVSLFHMGCCVEAASESAPERVTFLYTLTPGACPRSYGMNVGYLAGLPSSVVLRAAECAAQVEAATEAAAACRGGVQAVIGVAATQAVIQIARQLQQTHGNQNLKPAALLDVQKKLKLMLSRPH